MAGGTLDTTGRDDEERGATGAGAGRGGGHPRAAVFLVLVSLLGALGR
jgi:hypothetical protein